MSNLNDEKIIELYYCRDEQAISETADRYGAQLKRLAMNMLHDEQSAEECVNDVYFKAWNAIPPEKPQKFHAYIMKICRRNALRMLEHQSAKKRNAETVELTQEMLECIPDSSSEINVQSEQLVGRLNQFLTSLDSQKRIVFIKRYWYGESSVEIAKELGCSEGKIRTMLYRTRSKLKKYLESEDENYERQNHIECNDGH
ncbi:MAG: RNA polymerase sigma factor [Ruminococcus sp.]|nr:RNA polymerase sigma factor [Ruminococcus sp.]